VFDEASRYAVKIDPPAFFTWVTGVPAVRLALCGWIETRAAPHTHEPELPLRNEPFAS
jgi:hypothetical protein